MKFKMIKDKQYSESTKEKIISQYILLTLKGYGYDYCKTKLRRYWSILEEYLPIISKLEKVGFYELNDDYLKNTLLKIYSNSSFQNRDSGNFKIIKNKRFHSILKPAIIFIFVVFIFSFSFIGILFASQKSLPSNTLYPIKRYSENIQLLVTPQSKKNILHYKFLNNRLDEAKSFLNSYGKDRNKLDNIIMDAEEEFENCKKYNYFGNHSEKEIMDLIEEIKAKSLDEFNQDENSTDTSKDSETDDSNDMDEDVSNTSEESEQDTGEESEPKEPDLEKDSDDDIEIDDNEDPEETHETEDDSESHDSNENESESSIEED